MVKRIVGLITCLVTLIEIPPYRLVPVDINKSNSLMLYVRCDGTSYAKEGKYFLSIQTNYSFDNVKDGETFKITREKVRVDPEVYYERLFLIAEKSICLSESHFVIDKLKEYDLPIDIDILSMGMVENKL